MHRSLSVICYGAVFSAAVLLGWSSIARGQNTNVQGGESSKLLRLAGESIPAPPQQAVAWKAPETNLSKEFVSATATLFQQGLADLRGCEYREIEVVVGSFEPPWSDTTQKTHGWVLPDADKQSQHFGICWNGLVYPLVSIGKPADMRADASAAAKGEVEDALVGTGRYWNAYFEDFCLCHPWEGRSVSHDSPLPVKACLLLRMGEAELADKIWNRWRSGLANYPVPKQLYNSTEESSENVEANKPYLKDPYLILANCWTLSLFDRAVAAHMRGDDHLALASAEMLATVRPAVEAEAANRGFARPSPEKIQQGAAYFLLDAHRASELLADQRRRVKDRRLGVAPPVLSGDYPDLESLESYALALAKHLTHYPEKTRRIELLVRELEEESLASFGQCIGASAWSFGGENVVAAFLANEGEDSVEPLLACLESDARLTRFERITDRYPLPVYVFAESALEEVLKMPFHTIELDQEKPEHDESKRRQAKVAQIRAYWTRYKSVPMAERWYRILADDRAEPEQWSAAARAILQPASIPVTLDTVTRGWDNSWRRVKGKRKLHGDVLRNKTNPSVTELMARRIESLNAPYFESLGRGAKLKELQKKIRTLEERLEKLGEQHGKTGEQQTKELEKQKGELEKKCDELTNQQDDQKALESGCDMALCLAQWDPAGALPYLRRLTENRHTDLVTMVLTRAAAGDLAALDEYAAWVRKVQPELMWNGYTRAGIFLSRFIASQTIQQLPRRLSGFSTTRHRHCIRFSFMTWGKKKNCC